MYFIAWSPLSQRNGVFRLIGPIEETPKKVQLCTTDRKDMEAVGIGACGTYQSLQAVAAPDMISLNSSSQGQIKYLKMS